LEELAEATIHELKGVDESQWSHLYLIVAMFQCIFDVRTRVLAVNKLIEYSRKQFQVEYDFADFLRPASDRALEVV